MYHKHPYAFKAKLVKLYENGNSVTKIISDNNVPRSTLYYWLNKYKVIRRTKSKTITARGFYLLEERLKKAETENTILKECNCTQFSHIQDKLIAISKLDGKYTIHALCRALNVRRSTYYHYKLRRPERTQIEIQDDKYKQVIQSIFEDTKGRIGARKIKALMELKGYSPSERRISRLMKELELICVTNRKYKKYNYHPKSKYNRNLLDRNFKTDLPNKVWVSDITTIHVDYQPHYLCVVIDLFSRKIIGYSIGNHQETSLIELAFKKAQDSRNPDNGLLFHSDLGGQYTSYSFKALLRKNKVTQSFSNAGCPYDNAVAESFFRHLKDEQINQTYYRNYDSFKESMDEYIDFFNNKRPHYGLGNKIPSQYEEAYFESIV